MGILSRNLIFRMRIFIPAMDFWVWNNNCALDWPIRVFLQYFMMRITKCEKMPVRNWIKWIISILSKYQNSIFDFNCSKELSQQKKSYFQYPRINKNHLSHKSNFVRTLGPSNSHSPSFAGPRKGLNESNKILSPSK